MKAKNLIFLFITAIVLSSLPIINNVQCNWGVSDGTKIDYIINEADWVINYGEQSITISSTKFEGVKIQPNSEFEVQVKKIDEWGLEFEVDNTTTTASGLINNDLFIFEFDNFLYFPEKESERLYNLGFDAPSFNSGFPLFDWFFIEPSSVIWNFLTSIASIDYHQAKTNDLDYEAYFESDYERADSQSKIDILMYGNFVNETNKVEMQFQHNIKFIWHEITGILLGYRVASSFSGTFNSLFLSEELTLSLRKTDYNLPNFKFVAYSGLFPGFDFLIGIIAVITTTISIFIIKRKKIKK